MFTFAVLTFPNIDPVLFSIGPFAVRWYALAYIVGLIFGIWYMKRLVSNPKLWAGTTPSATPQQIDDFFLLAMLGVVLGGRIGYLLFYGWTQVQSDPLYIFPRVGRRHVVPWRIFRRDHRVLHLCQAARHWA